MMTWLRDGRLCRADTLYYYNIISEGENTPPGMIWSYSDVI